MDRINQFASSAKQATSSAINFLSRMTLKPRSDKEREELLRQNRDRPIEEVIRDMDESDMNSQGSHHSDSSLVEVIKAEVTKSMNSETSDPHIRYEQGYNAGNNVSQKTPT